MKVEIESKLSELATRQVPPTPESLERSLAVARLTYKQENADIRPADDSNQPGGLVKLRHDLDTIIIPDLHARRDFLLALFSMPGKNAPTVLDELEEGLVQVVCVGDGFHAEGRAAMRWRKAFEEFTHAYKTHKNIDLEMTESLALMEMIMELKVSYPDYFHFLKGNHENILNENGNGNYPFGKYAYEGEMVADYMKMFYGEELTYEYAFFEKDLPVFVIGKNFLVSHAEPERFFTEDEIINYRNKPEVIYGLTWTADDAAEEGSVQAMLEHYLGSLDDVYYFGGHRPVSELYNKRALGQYIQLHNPYKFIVCRVPCDKDFDPDTDIIEIEKE